MTTSAYVTQITNGIITLVSETATLDDESTLTEDQYFALMFYTQYRSHLRNYEQYHGNVNYNIQFDTYDIDINKLAFDQGYYISKNYRQIADDNRGRVIIVTTTDITKCIELEFPVDTVPVPIEEEGILTDYDGNVYTTIDMGNQRWIVENFKATHYADGTAISNIILRGATDMLLPSKDELNEMYTNLHLHGVGDFAAGTYWSSSESSATEAWMQDFSTGTQTETLKSTTCHVRAFRYFIAEIGAYSLRDTGPSGGLIFYIDGSGALYYEAALTDVSISKSWSNVDDVEISWTGTDIGYGETNTSEIVWQAGHVTSAAYLCYNLEVDGFITDITGAYCWYDNNIIYKNTYGALYNHYALNNVHGFPYLKRGSTREVGWKVPTSTDIINLIDNIGDWSIAGGKLKEIGLGHWLTPNFGATDTYGFKGIGAGNRFCDTGDDQGFDSIHKYGDFWLSDDTGFGNGYAWYLDYNSTDLFTPTWTRYCALTVKLMKYI
jgi:uncharacterized protein (TIGR02145 family)